MLPGLFSFAGHLSIDSWCLVLPSLPLFVLFSSSLSLGYSIPNSLVPWAEILQSRKQVLTIQCKVF